MDVLLNNFFAIFKDSRPVAFETETRPETFETETRNNGSRDSITDAVAPVTCEYNILMNFVYKYTR